MLPTSLGLLVTFALVPPSAHNVDPTIGKGEIGNGGTIAFEGVGQVPCPK